MLLTLKIYNVTYFLWQGDYAYLHMSWPYVELGEDHESIEDFWMMHLFSNHILVVNSDRKICRFCCWIKYAIFLLDMHIRLLWSHPQMQFPQIKLSFFFSQFFKDWLTISFKKSLHPATPSNLFLICQDWICFFFMKSEIHTCKEEIGEGLQFVEIFGNCTRLWLLYQKKYVRYVYKHIYV